MGERDDQDPWTSLGLQTMTVDDHKCFSGDPATVVNVPVKIILKIRTVS